MNLPRTPRAFTLIELLVVIAVIAVLAGMLLAGLSQLRQVRAKTITARLIQDIGVATILHLSENGTLPTGYATTPAAALGDPQPGRPPLLALRPTQRSSDGQILDDFRRPLLVEVIMATRLGKAYIQRIRWCSEGRHPSRESTVTARIDDPVTNHDDVLFVFEADAGGQGGFIRVK